MEPLFPPAAVRPDTTDLSQWAYEATSALEAAAQAAHTTLERYREAGEALAKMKANCKGKWLWTLQQHGIDRFRAAEAMRVHAKWELCASSRTLKDALRLIASPEPEVEPGEETKTGELIPELALKGVSPKILPEILKLSVGQQYQYLNNLNAGMNPRDALAEAQKAPAGPRKAGEDPDEEDPFGKAINTTSKAWTEKVQLVERIHEVPEGKPQELQGLLRKFFREFKAATQTPLKPVPPPEPGKCKRCGREVLFVTSRLGKRFALDADRTTWGRFDLRGGLAVYVQRDPTSDVLLHAAHVRSCPFQPSGKK